jgi:hypothetical protein
MAGVRPAVEPHDGVEIAHEQVDELALALVSPLKADDADIGGLVHARLDSSI